MIIPRHGSWMSLSVGHVAELHNWSCSYDNIATMCCCCREEFLNSTICQNSAQHKRETLWGKVQWLLQNKQTDKQTNKDHACSYDVCQNQSLAYLEWHELEELISCRPV
jgi:hypothetical protein